MADSEKSWWDSIAESLENAVEGVSEAVDSFINPSMQDKLKSLQDGLAAQELNFDFSPESTSAIEEAKRRIDIQKRGVEFLESTQYLTVSDVQAFIKDFETDPEQALIDGAALKEKRQEAFELGLPPPSEPEPEPAEVEEKGIFETFIGNVGDAIYRQFNPTTAETINVLENSSDPFDETGALAEAYKERDIQNDLRERIERMKQYTYDDGGGIKSDIKLAERFREAAEAPPPQKPDRAIDRDLAASQPYKPDGEVTSITPSKLKSFDI